MISRCREKKWGRRKEFLFPLIFVAPALIGLVPACGPASINKETDDVDKVLSELGVPEPEPSEDEDEQSVTEKKEEPRPFIRTAPQKEVQKPDPAILAALERWKANIPGCLLPEWEKVKRFAVADELKNGFNCSEMERLLEQNYPSTKARLRVLAKWVGSVDEPWDHSYGLESVCGCLFWGYSMKQKRRLLNDNRLTTTELDGMIRMLSEDHLSEETPSRRQKQIMMKRCALSKHSYNHQRCKIAFDTALDKPINLLGNYDFSKGGYAVVGYARGDQRHPISEQIGDFYVDTLGLLRQLRSKWITGRSAGYFACGYHYNVIVVRNTEIVGSLSFNFDDGCNTVVGDHGDPRWFRPELFEQFASKYKKPVFERKQFSTLDEGRKYLEAISDDPRILVSPKPEWELYEGEFSFEYPCSYKTEQDWTDYDRCVNEAESKLQASYPDEPFELESGGGGHGKVFVYIRCRKSLHDKFDLFPIGYRKWSSYTPTLTVTWKDTYELKKD